MTTNNDATRALAKMPEIGTVNKTNVYEWFILHGETIRTALLKSAQVDGLVKALQDINASSSDAGSSANKTGNGWIAEKCREISDQALQQFSATEI